MSFLKDFRKGLLEKRPYFNGYKVEKYRIRKDEVQARIPKKGWVFFGYYEDVVNNYTKGLYDSF